MRAAWAAPILCGALASGAGAAESDLVRAHRGLYPAAEAAALRASGPEPTQAAYDLARDLQEAVRAAGPPGPDCLALRESLARYAAGRVLQMEGVDRPSAGDVHAGRAAADRSRASIARAARACPGTGGGRPRPALAISPVDGEVFYGTIVARAPAGADAAALSVDGRHAARAAVRGGRVRFELDAPPGAHDLRVSFSRAAAAAGESRVRAARLLGPAALRARPASAGSTALARDLGRALARGPRHRAAWVQDLTTGAAPGVDADAVFPAASTVKLGLMAGALVRLGARPEASPLAADLRAIAGWSSNLATHRILRRLGGTTVATDGLRRLGARASTFPGEYIVGTALVPRVSQRVTTARDLARMLFTIHAAAAGAGEARVRSGLTGHQARLLLGWLLASQQRGDNVGLFGGDDPIAQKNGWISDARLGTAIVYDPRGPFIVTLATYDDAGVSLRAARELGRRIRDVAARPTAR